MGHSKPKYNSAISTFCHYNEFEDNKHKNRIVIICFYNSYKIVISLLKKENEYLILSAYYVKNEKRHM